MYHGAHPIRIDRLFHRTVVNVTCAQSSLDVFVARSRASALDSLAEGRPPYRGPFAISSLGDTHLAAAPTASIFKAILAKPASCVAAVSSAFSSQHFATAAAGAVLMRSARTLAETSQLRRRANAPDATSK